MASEDYRRSAQHARSLLLAASSVVEAHLLNLPVSDPALAGVLPGYVDAGGRGQLSPFHDGDARRLPGITATLIRCASWRRRSSRTRSTISISIWSRLRRV